MKTGKTNNQIFQLSKKEGNGALPEVHRTQLSLTSDKGANGKQGTTKKGRNDF